MAEGLLWTRCAVATIAAVGGIIAVCESTVGEARAMAGGVPPAARESGSSGRSLSDIELTPQTTLDEIVALWGEPHLVGPAREMLAYGLGPGQTLWLSFTSAEPRRLTRALLLTEGFGFTVTTLLNELEITKTRRRDQLDRCRRLTPHEVHAVWGPPDNVTGSGLTVWQYRMADGEMVDIVFLGGVIIPLNPRRPGCENSIDINGGERGDA